LQEDRRNLRLRRLLRMAGLIGLLSLCSCATRPFPAPRFPQDISINDCSRYGEWIQVKLRLDNGKEFSVMVDTGGPRTVLDKSLEPWLGKSVGRGTWYEPMEGGLLKVNLYAAPKVYAGETRLCLPNRICTYDLQKACPGLMGILGMDTLRNYCIQFDFAHHTMRLLDPRQPAGGNLGEGFPLTILFGLVIAHTNFFDTGNIHFCPDTGCTTADAIMEPFRLNRVLKKQKPVWEDHLPSYSGAPKRLVGFSTGEFANHSYSDLIFQDWPGAWPGGNLIGLPFLSRNLVTFNFPRRMMYLKQETAKSGNSTHFATMAAGKYLNRLRKDGQLPWWTTNENGAGETPALPHDFTSHPLTLTFDCHKAVTPGWVDVTAKVNALVNGGARQVSVGNTLAGFDPARNDLKRLRVTYRVNRQQQAADAKEGATLFLPAGAKVLSAHYGKLESNVEYHGPVIEDKSTYHFTVVQDSEAAPWKLKKAWQTDAGGKGINEYLVL